MDDLIVTQDKPFSFEGKELIIFWGEEDNHWIYYDSTGKREIFSSKEEVLTYLLNISSEKPVLYIKEVDYGEEQTYLDFLYENRRVEMEVVREKFKSSTHHHFYNLDTMTFYPLSEIREGFLIFREDKVHLLGMEWGETHIHTYQGEKEIDLLYGMLSYNLSILERGSYISSSENIHVSPDEPIPPNTLLVKDDSYYFLNNKEDPPCLYEMRDFSKLTSTLGKLPSEDGIKIVTPLHLEEELKVSLRYLLSDSLDDIKEFAEKHSTGIMTHRLSEFSFYPLNSLEHLFYAYNKEEKKLSILGRIETCWFDPEYVFANGFCFQGEDADLVMAVIAYNCVYLPPY